MLFFFLFILLAVNAAVLPRDPTSLAGVADNGCEDEFENIEMSVFNDGPNAAGVAGIGAEFETIHVNFHNNDCSLQDTFASKGGLVQGRTGLNFELSVDTGVEELGQGRLDAEYILDGRSIRVGDGSAAAAGRAATNDFMGWTPWAENPPNQITILDFPQCNPWIITGVTPATNKGDIPWAPQVTAPMPLEALYSLMRENLGKVETGRNILNGRTSGDQNIQLVTQEYFQSSSLGIPASSVSDDMLGFCSLVLSYAKAADIDQGPDKSPKLLLPFMPRTEFNTIYAQVSLKFMSPLFDIFNKLACYKTDSSLQVTLDDKYCTGTPANPVPGTLFAGLQYTYNGQGAPNTANPQTINIQNWIQGIAVGNPELDLLSAFDKNYDTSIGGFATATEQMFNSQRVVPLFEFRNLDPQTTTKFESFMGRVDSSIQALHQQFATPPARKIRLRRQSDNGSCILPVSNTNTGNPTTSTTAVSDSGPGCGPNLGQVPCPASSTSPPSGPDCGPNLGQVPCLTSSSSPPSVLSSATPASTIASTTVAATTVQLPSSTASPPCNDIEECDEQANAARPSCQTADDCDAGCAKQFANNTQALTVGFASTCIDQAFCTCSVEAAEIAAQIIIAIGDIVCVVWNEALQGAAAALAFVIPYVGEVAEGVDATELFEAADRVFKRGAEDCNLACPGHQYTAVDPMDVNSMLGINECGDDEATASPGT